jgi:hypothetical protein
MFKINYCEFWGRYKEIINEYTEEQSKKLHMAKETYSVVLGGLKKPHCYMEIRNDFIGVGFLDDNLREYLSYDYYEVATNKLFLKTVIYREFEGDTDKLVKASLYDFQESGKVKIERNNYLDNTVSESEGNMDISVNYEKYPDFGEYTNLAWVDRVKDTKKNLKS